MTTEMVNAGKRHNMIVREVADDSLMEVLSITVIIQKRIQYTDPDGGPPGYKTELDMGCSRFDGAEYLIIFKEKALVSLWYVSTRSRLWSGLRPVHGLVHTDSVRWHHAWDTRYTSRTATVAPRSMIAVDVHGQS